MMTYTINGPILELKGEGAYTTKDIAAVLVAAKADPRLPSPTSLLVDIRESEITHSFTDVSARLLLVLEQLGSSMRPFVAFVVTGVARDRLAHIYQTRAADTTDLRVEVFSDPKAARDWLLSV